MEPTLAEKVSLLQRQLNLPEGANLVDAVDNALEKIGLADELQGQPLTIKVDAALQTLGMTPQTVPMGTPVSIAPITAPHPTVVEARVVQEAEEQALAQQSRMAALEKALRDAMPGWLGWWNDQSTETLQTAIAQAEAAFPPEGSSLQAALLKAKAALRSQEEEKARRDAEARARRDAEARARGEAEARARREAEQARVRNQRMERARGPLTQDELAGCWGTLNVWLIIPAFGCVIYDRRANGHLGQFGGLWFDLCILPCPTGVDPGYSWPAEWHYIENRIPRPVRLCGPDYTGPCNAIKGPMSFLETGTICITEIRLLPC